MIGGEKGSLLSTLNVENQYRIRANNNYGFKTLKSKRNSSPKEFVKEKWITPWGGQVKVGNNSHGISSLSFVPGAVAEDVLVRFWWGSAVFMQGGSGIYPHGIQFSAPIILRLSYQNADLNGVDENNLKIFYYNEGSCEWEALVSKINRNKKEVVAFINHFSRYAIGEIR
jgi:hypothetical protein